MPSTSKNDLRAGEESYLICKMIMTEHLRVILYMQVKYVYYRGITVINIGWPETLCIVSTPH